MYWEVCSGETDGASAAVIYEMRVLLREMRWWRVVWVLVVLWRTRLTSVLSDLNPVLLWTPVMNLILRCWLQRLLLKLNRRILSRGLILVMAGCALRSVIVG